MDGSEFDRLLEEGASAPVGGWGFSWFMGRATEERPTWRYAALMSDRMAHATRAVDLQTGGGEVLAELAAAPRLLLATEGWPPNVAVAQRNLQKLGAHVVHCADNGPLPFLDEVFDLVVSRHPTVTPWSEIERILVPAGTFLSQQIGPGSLHELTEHFLGPQPRSMQRSPTKAVADAEAAGLVVVQLQEATLQTVFFDTAAVVAFLRKVIWIVPGFTVEGHREALAAMHQHISLEGRFVAHAKRFLIEARKPDFRERPKGPARSCNG